MSEREQCIEVGKRWAGEVFEELREQYRDQVPIYHWIWKESRGGHTIRFLTAGRDDIQFIPSEHHAFSQDQLAACGNPPPASDPPRQEVKDHIRSRFEFLATHLHQSK
jgi:hypothetical protein